MTDPHAQPKGLSLDECRAKAQECQKLAHYSKNENHRTMLLKIAESWLRIGTSSSQRSPVERQASRGICHLPVDSSNPSGRWGVQKGLYDYSDSTKESVAPLEIGCRSANKT